MTLFANEATLIRTMFADHKFEIVNVDWRDYGATIDIKRVDTEDVYRMVGVPTSLYQKIRKMASERGWVDAEELIGMKIYQTEKGAQRGVRTWVLEDAY